ncbi:membrane protein insertase YidC [Streptomyces caniscabiei]|uniref:membrane protein insertase YidC n=1 Tax=Streptomyces caniscabiei TaxID=2746961 RepID=UPI0029C038BC|nr:membrane protein insertase YidC [Streptomyces caniscabiei]
MFDFLINPIVSLTTYIGEILPGMDLAIPILLVTLLSRVLLWPLSSKQNELQAKIDALQGKVDVIKEQNKSDFVKRSDALTALYRKNGINPLLLSVFGLVQLPILLLLIVAFGRAAEVSEFTILAFVQARDASLILAAFVGVTQFIYSWPYTQQGSTANKIVFRYVLPLLIAALATQFSAAVAWYWATNNILLTIQILISRPRRQLPRRDRA